MGVTYDKRRDNWTARIIVDGKRLYLGAFSTRDEASDVCIRRQVEIGSQKNLLEQQKHFTLANHKSEYIEDDVSFAWINGFRDKKFKEIVHHFRAMQIAVLVATRRLFRKSK